MDVPTLRRWYEALLEGARREGIVRSFTDLHTHTAQLKSVRDFPLFGAR